MSCAVSTVFCGKCASTLGLEERERHRRLEPGVSTRQSLVNRTGGDHGPVRKSMAKNRADSMPAITEPPRPRLVKAACPQLAAQGSGRVASEAIDELHAAVGTALRPVCGLDGTNRSESAQLGVHRVPTDRIRRSSADGMRCSRPLATARGWPGRRRPPRLG